jgi:hypothetical protein
MVFISFVRPESDSVEVNLSRWADAVLASIRGKPNVSSSDLRGAAHQLTLFFLHGQRNSLGDPVVWADSGNIADGKGTVLIAFACLAGDQLGPNAVTNGVRAFLGFDDILTNYAPQPGLFGQCVDAALRPFILSGQSIDAVRSALESGFQAIEKHYRAGVGTNHRNATIIWLAAHVNWRGLVFHGDPNATIP